MAEGGYLATSVHDGSDSHVDICCTPCNEDNIREEAVQYCPECHEYLCETCTRHHGRLRATRAHQLVDKDNAQPSHDAIGRKDVLKARCRYHPDRVIEIYCGTHDMVYCALCVAIDHRSCDKVRKIEDLTESDYSVKVDSLVVKGMQAREWLVSANEKKENNLKTIEEQKESIETNIKEISRKLREHTDDLEKKALNVLQEKHRKAKQELESDICQLKEKHKEVDETLSSLKSFSTLNTVHQFIETKLGQKVLREVDEFVKVSESNVTKVISFEANEQLTSSSLEAEALGEIHIVSTNMSQKTRGSPLTISSRTYINVKIPTDKSVYNISGICQLDDGLIVLSDYNNNRLKCFDSTFALKCYHDVAEGPLGVCHISKKEVAVKFHDKVLFFSVGTSFSILRKIKVNCGWYYGLGYLDGKLWLSTKRSVDIYNNAGILLRSIETDKTDCGLSIYHPENMVSSGEHMIVAGRSDGVVYFDSDGNMRKALRDKIINGSSGVCVTDAGIVLVAGYESNNVVQFCENGTCLGELIPNNKTLERPLFLFYNSKANMLIVTCHNSDVLYAFEIK